MPDEHCFHSSQMSAEDIGQRAVAHDGDFLGFELECLLHLFESRRTGFGRSTYHLHIQSIAALIQVDIFLVVAEHSDFEIAARRFQNAADLIGESGCMRCHKGTVEIEDQAFDAVFRQALQIYIAYVSVYDVIRPNYHLCLPSLIKGAIFYSPTPTKALCAFRLGNGLGCEEMFN